MTDSKDNQQIPMSVLDRVIKLSQENNESYAQMVSAMDTVAVNTMEMADALEKLSRNIDDEQLGCVVKESMDSIKGDISAVRMAVSCISAKHNIINALGKVFEFEQESEQDVLKKAKAMLWLLDIIGVFQRNKFLFSFCAGAVIVAVLGSAGVKIKDILLFLFHSF